MNKPLYLFWEDMRVFKNEPDHLIGVFDCDAAEAHVNARATEFKEEGCTNVHVEGLMEGRITVFDIQWVGPESPTKYHTLYRLDPVQINESLL